MDGKFYLDHNVSLRTISWKDDDDDDDDDIYIYKNKITNLMNTMRMKNILGVLYVLISSDLKRKFCFVHAKW